jgi:eukaryotic-like serine/threonine-protein kinase
MKVIGPIARGGFGRVEKVRLNNGTIVARKVFDPDPSILVSSDCEKLLKRFKRETKVQSNLKGKFFMPILKCDLDCANPWFLMPLAEQNFMEQIRETKKTGTIPTQGLADILNALERLHSLGFTHRDLKPQNILLHEETWKLSDFGLVLPDRGFTTKLTSTNSAWGTMDYCAPEQLIDFKHVTSQADIYAFGCILHDIFDGSQRVPYERQSCAGAVGSIVEKCTERDPKKRFKSIASLRGGLLTVLSQSVSTQTSLDTTEWIKTLEKLDEWTVDRMNEFVRYLLKVAVQEDKIVLFRALDEDRLSALHKIDAELWHNIALEYCEWGKSAFAFDYCDVVIKRLECIFTLGIPECKANAVVSSAVLGASHNRWFVMERVLTLCTKSLEDRLAERIGIEILVQETQEEFQTCIEVMKHPMENLHPRIAACLKPSNNT